MNIWYLNHYANPPTIGTPGRPYALASNLQNLGHNVMIVCASFKRGLQPTGYEDLNKYKSYGGVNYYHLPTRSYQGNGLGRLMNMLDYSRGVRKLAAKIDNGEMSKPDILIPSCVHPLAFPPALFLARKYNAKLIYEVRDIWPLSLIELSGVPSYHPLVLWFGYIEKKAYREADAVVALMPNAFEHMVPLGLDRHKFHFIPNGIDRNEWNVKSMPLPEEHEKTLRQIKEQGKLIVIYAGAHGIPNALDQILDLKTIKPGNPKPYHFVFIGDGILKSSLLKRVKNEGISFISFLPILTKSQLISALELVDICFVGSQKKEIYQYGTSPNKLGDYFMCSKPVLSTLYSAGIKSNDFVQIANAGISVEPYNTNEIDKALKRFCAMTQGERQQMGENGRRYALENLDWEILGRRYAAICASI